MISIYFNAILTRLRSSIRSRPGLATSFGMSTVCEINRRRNTLTFRDGLYVKHV